MPAAGIEFLRNTLRLAASGLAETFKTLSLSLSLSLSAISERSSPSALRQQRRRSSRACS